MCWNGIQLHGMFLHEMTINFTGYANIICVSRCDINDIYLISITDIMLLMLVLMIKVDNKINKITKVTGKN